MAATVITVVGKHGHGPAGGCAEQLQLRWWRHLCSDRVETTYHGEVDIVGGKWVSPPRVLDGHGGMDDVQALAAVQDRVSWPLRANYLTPLFIV